MKNKFKEIITLFLITCMVFSLAACGTKTETKTVGSTKEVANDYYIDLTDLGMKLTIYLFLDEDGYFKFSNTLSFENDKSSGTFKKSGDEYIMVYTSVNGEEKSISDSLTSSFKVMEDGSLDFSGCEKIYYGSAGATTRSEDNPDAKLIAHIVPENFEEPDMESAFKTGTYVTEDVSENGVAYSHAVSFFGDNSYIHFMRYEQDGKMMFDTETGTYGVSSTQLALEPGDDTRIECEVADSSNLKLSILPHPGATDRKMLEFKKTDSAEEIMSLTGSGTVTASSETFNVKFRLYADGSYITEAKGFTEKGILAIDSAEKYFKQYPDHPTTGDRGLNQVATVPSGVLSYAAGGNVEFTDMRVRTSEGLTRYKCTVGK